MTIESSIPSSEAQLPSQESSANLPEKIYSGNSPEAQRAELDAAEQRFNKDKEATLSGMNKIYAELGIDKTAEIPERLRVQEEKLNKQKEQVKQGEYIDFEMVPEEKNVDASPEKLKAVEGKLETLFSQMRMMSTTEIQYFRTHGEFPKESLFVVILRHLFGLHVSQAKMKKIVAFYEAHHTETNFTQLAEEFVREEPELLETVEEPKAEAASVQELEAEEVPDQKAIGTSTPKAIEMGTGEVSKAA